MKKKRLFETTLAEISAKSENVYTMIMCKKESSTGEELVFCVGKPKDC